MGGRRASQCVRGHPGRDRNAERGRRRRRLPRCDSSRCHDDDVYGVAGLAADDPQYVQDRWRTDAGGVSCYGADPGHARLVHLRRPQRRDVGSQLRLGDARLGFGGRGAGHGDDLAFGHVPGAPSLPAFLRRVPHVARGEQDRVADGRRHPLDAGRRLDRRAPRAGFGSGSPGDSRNGPESGRVLPGARSLQSLL